VIRTCRIARNLGDQGTWPHVAQLPNFKTYVDKNAVLMARSLQGGFENLIQPRRALLLIFEHVKAVQRPLEAHACVDYTNLYCDPKMLITSPTYHFGKAKTANQQNNLQQALKNI